MNQTYQLKEIQLLFNTDQHVLIHLCEKGVIIPEAEDVSGRGKIRKFSKANVFEFAVALELRKYQIPVVTTGAILRILNSFKKKLRKENNDFDFPDSLINTNLLLYFYEGELLVFKVGKKILSFNIEKILGSENPQVRLEELKELPKESLSYFFIDLSKIAKKYKEY